VSYKLKKISDLCELLLGSLDSAISGQQDSLRTSEDQSQGPGSNASHILNHIIDICQDDRSQSGHGLWEQRESRLDRNGAGHADSIDDDLAKEGIFKGISVANLYQGDSAGPIELSSLDADLQSLKAKQPLDGVGEQYETEEKVHSAQKSDGSFSGPKPTSAESSSLSARIKTIPGGASKDSSSDAQGRSLKDPARFGVVKGRKVQVLDNHPNSQEPEEAEPEMGETVEIKTSYIANQGESGASQVAGQDLRAKSGRFNLGR